MKQFFIYMMTNEHNAVIYIGITSNLIRRVYQHKAKATKGFTARYNLSKLVYYEVCEDANAAISREKQLKGGSRAKKVSLINNFNKEWSDLYDNL